MRPSDPARGEKWLFGVLFAAALSFHFLCTTFNWSVPFLAGHEFRQSQTALITYYIDRENDFSLLYEQPILGKPWVSLLLEVPLYEWAVVGVSRATGWPHHVAARTISLASFYLALPAFFLLLGRFRLNAWQRLLPLALVLVCPVYIYYSRAFLIDAMALACSAWFLAGFVRTMDERRLGWLLLTIVAGTAAGLIKSALFIVWLLPGAVYGAWALWTAWRDERTWRAVVTTMVWGLATVIVPLAALRWWVSITDPIKAAHASAHIFTSANLSQGNWGLFDARALFSAELWRTLLARWSEAIMPPLWLAGFAGAGLLVARRRGLMGWAVIGGFLAPQLLMPFAYAYQDYYFYSCAVFLLVGLGMLALAAPLWARWGIAGVLVAVMAQTYWRGYRQEQAIVNEGGAPFTEIIRDHTPRDSVIVVAGADWAAMIPYYSERRALMIRNGLEYDGDYLRRAFADLAGEEVSAVVLQGQVRLSADFIRLFTEWFDMAETPTLTHDGADVYVSQRHAARVQAQVGSDVRYAGLHVPAVAGAATRSPVVLDPAVAGGQFPVISPEPFQADFEFGIAMTHLDGVPVLSAHPDCDVWIRLEEPSSEIRWEFGISAAAYERDGGTNGVQMIIWSELPGQSPREIWRCLVDPTRRSEDRGLQSMRLEYRGTAGEVLHFSTRANGNKAFDWAFWKKIEVR